MEAKPVKKRHRKYDADFKREVIKMIESGRSVSDVSQSLGLGSNFIYVWLKRAKGKDLPGRQSDSSFDEEKASMHKRIRAQEKGL